MTHLFPETTLKGGTYRITRFISSGGFGCTYEAEHLMLGAHVAIKEFFVKDFCNRNESTGAVEVGTYSKEEIVSKLKKKFIEEARVLFRFNHPGIVHVIDVFEENGTAYYVMDYINGCSLHDVLVRKGVLSEQEAVYYILQIADALEYVHNQNRLHLDIKPGNVMVNADNHVILIDFGLSKHYDDESGENTSTMLGANTPGYAPIEQITQSLKMFSPATDIYALGATLYKLLTGITPPSSAMLMSEDFQLSPLPSSVSESVKLAVSQAMQMKRKDRPQTIEEFKKYFINIKNVPIENSFEKNNEVDIFNDLVEDLSATEFVSDKNMNNFYQNMCYVDSLGKYILDGEQGVYSGELKQNLPNGQGRMTFDNGDVYIGDWKDGKMHGLGVYSWSDGRKYDGEWILGKRNGHGTFSWPGGEVYIGEWNSNKVNGLGSFIFADGGKYVGEFKEGKMDGNGVQYDFRGKEVFNGIWKNGKFIGRK